MSEKRRNVVRSLFTFLNQQIQGRLLLGNLYRHYQAKFIQEQELDRKQQIKLQKNLSNVKRSKDDQSISEEEFLNYYTVCNATLSSEKEEYFTDLLTLT